MQVWLEIYLKHVLGKGLLFFLHWGGGQQIDNTEVPCHPSSFPHTRGTRRLMCEKYLPSVILSEGNYPSPAHCIPQEIIKNVFYHLQSSFLPAFKMFNTSPDIKDANGICDTGTGSTMVAQYLQSDHTHSHYHLHCNSVALIIEHQNHTSHHTLGWWGSEKH